MPYYVYVIKLDKKVLLSKKFREKNPFIKTRKACYYVGQSAKIPEERFKQHRQGYKANKYAYHYGIKLVPRKYKKYNPVSTRKKAEEIEQKLTKKLRKKGHGVWSN